MSRLKNVIDWLEGQVLYAPWASADHAMVAVSHEALTIAHEELARFDQELRQVLDEFSSLGAEEEVKLGLDPEVGETVTAPDVVKGPASSLD